MFTNLALIPEVALPDEFRLNPNTNRIVSDDLRDAIAAATEDWVNEPFTVISANEVTTLRREVFQKMNAKNLAYHNGKHGRDMEARVIAYANGDLPIAILSIAAIFHDFDHVGKSFRQTIHTDDWRSNEEIAVLHFDEWAKGKLTLRERLIIQGLILATTFMAHDVAKLKEMSRPYTPTTQAEILFQFADICSMDESLVSFTEGGVAVAIEMSGETTLEVPKIFGSQCWFIDHVRSKFEAVMKYLDPHNAQRIQARIDNCAAYCTCGLQSNNRMANLIAAMI